MNANVRFYVVHKDGSFTEYNANLEPLIFGICQDQKLAELAKGDTVVFDRPKQGEQR